MPILQAKSWLAVTTRGQELALVGMSELAGFTTRGQELLHFPLNLMNRLDKKESAAFKFYIFFSISDRTVFPDYLEVAAAVVVPHGIDRPCLCLNHNLRFHDSIFKIIQVQIDIMTRQFVQVTSLSC